MWTIVSFIDYTFNYIFFENAEKFMKVSISANAEVFNYLLVFQGLFSMFDEKFLSFVCVTAQTEISFSHLSNKIRVWARTNPTKFCKSDVGSQYCALLL